MREIVRGTIDVYAAGPMEIGTPGSARGPGECEFLEGRHKVLILPIEDGKVGPFERRHLEWVRWVINDLHEQGDKYTHLAHKAAEVHEELYAAISRLFEEVESED